MFSRSRRTLALLSTAGALTGLVAAHAVAKTPDGETPSEETICDGVDKPLQGLCNAYCEAKDCHLDEQENTNACEQLLDNYHDKSDGIDPPCLSRACKDTCLDEAQEARDACIESGASQDKCKKLFKTTFEQCLPCCQIECYDGCVDEACEYEPNCMTACDQHEAKGIAACDAQYDCKDKDVKCPAGYSSCLKQVKLKAEECRDSCVDPKCAAECAQDCYDGRDGPSGACEEKRPDRR